MKFVKEIINKEEYIAPIPKGFKVVNRVYSYPHNTDNGIAVTSIEGTKSSTPISTGLVIQDDTNDIQTKGNVFVWIPVPDITKFVRENFLGETSNINNIFNTFPEYKAMYNSVKTYKGFYMAMFEAGNDTDSNITKPVSKYFQPVWSSVKFSVPSTLYIEDPDNITAADDTAYSLARSVYKPSNSNVGVVSTISYGEQWDAAMRFVMNYGSKRTEIVTNDIANPGEATYERTGVAWAAACANNLYDIRGNYLELTAEGNNSMIVGRGGAIYKAAGRRINNPASTIVQKATFRICLYIK